MLNIFRNIFSPRGVADISPKTTGAINSAIKEDRAVTMIRAEKMFYKGPSSFAGETFFQTVAVLTGRRFIIVKETGSYHEIKSFSLEQVSGCSSLSDSGKPALLVNFSDNSQVRLVFSSPDPLIDGFEKEIAQSAAGGYLVCPKCGTRTGRDSRFCSRCGAALDFAPPENTL